MSWFFSKAFVFDPDAQNYFDQIGIAGSSIDSTAKLAINDFVLGCKADSFWTILKDVGPLCGTDLTAALVKLKKLSTGWSYTNGNFVSGDYSQSTGLTGNGTTKYLNSGVNATLLTGVSASLAVYNRTTANGTQNAMGAVLDGSNIIQLLAPHSTDEVASQMGTSALATAITGAVGFVQTSLSPDPLHEDYRNGSSLASSGSVGGTFPNLEIYFFARNLNGVGANLFSAHNQSFLSISGGMDDTQAANFYTRVHTLQTDLGRNV